MCGRNSREVEPVARQDAHGRGELELPLGGAARFVAVHLADRLHGGAAHGAVGPAVVEQVLPDRRGVNVAARVAEREDDERVAAGGRLLRALDDAQRMLHAGADIQSCAGRWCSCDQFSATISPSSSIPISHLEAADAADLQRVPRFAGRLLLRRRGGLHDELLVAVLTAILAGVALGHALGAREADLGQAQPFAGGSGRDLLGCVGRIPFRQRPPRSARAVP